MVVEISMEGVFVIMFFVLLAFVLQAFIFVFLVRKRSSVSKLYVVDAKDSVVSKKRRAK